MANLARRLEKSFMKEALSWYYGQLLRDRRRGLIMF